MTGAVNQPGEATLSAVAEEAQRELRDRPRLTIRRRLTVGFVVWLSLSVAITVVSLVLVGRVEVKLRTVETVDHYVFEIQQARRFEKNYFLYRTNLDDALAQAAAARDILARDGADIAAVVGAAALEAMRVRLERYREALQRLAPGAPAVGAGGLDAIEAELRLHGAEMVRVAEDMAARERASVAALLLMAQRITVGFLAGLLLLAVVLATFIARQMLAPLHRIVRATRRIADGDLTPITPRRKYYDEFSELAVAINHMLHELVRRQELLVQAHKLQAVGTLTAGVAHELNNPVNNIMLTAAALQEDHDALSDAERLDMVKDLVSESERARDIVRNLLDFARESETELTPLDVEQLVGETLQLASNQVKLAKVRVCGEVEENLPAVYGDRHQLTQVCLNLVLNALDAMPGGGTLTISAERADDGNCVQLRFADTGVGIPAANLGSIFDPFFSSKKHGKGTGLGLSVSLGIVQQHGGHIGVESEPGKGTTFTVSLPIAKVPARMPGADEGGVVAPDPAPHPAPAASGPAPVGGGS
jgi:two-component system NtrC family sensor kinase